MSDYAESVGPSTVADCILWLDRKYARHGEIEDKEAADYLRTFAAQLARATELLKQCDDAFDCKGKEDVFHYCPNCDNLVGRHVDKVGLAAFLKEIGP